MLNESFFDENISTIDNGNPWSNLNVPYTIAELLVAVAAIVGNLLVIVVYLREKRLRKATKYYIISLAIADLLVGFFGIPFAILASVGLPRNIYLCLFNMSLLIVLCTISINCLVAVSVDRYWAILYPMSYSRNVRSKTAIEIIFICWLTGALVGFLPLLGWNEGGPTDRKCFFVEVMNYNYLVFLYFSTIIAPAVLLAAFYANIYRVVLQQIRQMVLLSPASLSPMKRSGGMLRVLGAARKKEVKATQNLSVIVLFFIICWFPLYTINFVKAICRDCNVNSTLTDLCIIMSHLNSSFNPFLYAYHLKDFRVALHNLIFRNKNVPQHQTKSSFLQRYRSEPRLTSQYHAPHPTSSVYLYNDDISINKTNRNWHLKTRVWTLPNLNCDLRSNIIHEEISHSSVNPSKYVSQAEHKMTVPFDLSVRPIPESENQNFPRFRSKSVCVFQPEQECKRINNSKMALKEIKNYFEAKNKTIDRTTWSCEDLRMKNNVSCKRTTKL